MVAALHEGIYCSEEDLRQTTDWCGRDHEGTQRIIDFKAFLLHIRGRRVMLSAGDNSLQYTPRRRAFNIRHSTGDLV